MRTQDGAASRMMFDPDADCSIHPEKRATKRPKVFNLHAKSLGWKKERREKDTGV